MDKFKKLVKETFEALGKLHFEKTPGAQPEDYTVYFSIHEDTEILVSVFLEPEFNSKESSHRCLAITFEILGSDMILYRVLIDSEEEVNIELALRNHLSKVIDDYCGLLKKYWVEIE